MMLLWRGISAQVWCLERGAGGWDAERGEAVYVDAEMDSEEPDCEGYAQTDEAAIEQAWQQWDARWVE
jgi:hypothetical protein